MAIKFYSNRTSIVLPNRIKLKKFINNIFYVENIKIDKLVYVFCKDDYLLQINKEFLGHDYLTDIITFTLSNVGEAIIGEIYISIERVKDNALTLKIPFNVELHRIMLHGALHLCGYNDKTPSQKRIMSNNENKYLNIYFQ